MKKDKGALEYGFSFMLILLAVALLLYVYQMRLIKHCKLRVEDAIVAANLAGAVIDLKEYGRSHTVLITDIDRSYELYCHALQNNLNLESDFESQNKDLIHGKVTVHEFSVYNVDGQNIIKYSVGEDGHLKVIQLLDGLGKTKTPNGIQVQNTTIYSKIGFWIKGFQNQMHYVYKENSVDVVGKIQKGE